jgi:hypothetical protein
MKVVTGFVIAVAIYLGYQLSPIPECLEIAGILDDTANSTPFSVRWNVLDQASCVFATDAQRRNWLSSAQMFRFHASQFMRTLQ